MPWLQHPRKVRKYTWVLTAITPVTLESAPDRAKLADSEDYLGRHEDKLVVLDEIQRAPGLFQALRGMNEALAEGRLCISPISFRELALTGDVALPSATRDLHGDPADRFIAATAITHRATLLTADARLLDWKHAAKRQNARK